MAGFTGLLTQKIGPFPGWVWALGVGGLVFLVGPKVLGKSSGSTATAGTPGGFDPQSFAAGFSQGAAQYQGSTPDRTNPASPAAPADPSQPPIGHPRVVPPPVVASGLRPQPPGVGGFTRNRSASIGSLTADPHAYWHPAMKQQPRFPHFVRAGVGGAPVAHAAAVHQLAHQAEIHPARLQSLNPRDHRFIRVA